MLGLRNRENCHQQYRENRSAHVATIGALIHAHRRTSNPQLLLEQVTSAPACIRDPTFVGDLASIISFTVCELGILFVDA